MDEEENSDVTSIELTISVVRDPTTKAGLWCGSDSRVSSMALIEIQSNNTKKDVRSQKIYIEQKNHNIVGSLSYGHNIEREGTNITTDV